MDMIDLSLLQTILENECLQAGIRLLVDSVINLRPNLFAGIKSIARCVFRGGTRSQPRGRHFLVSLYSYLDNRKPMTGVPIHRRCLIRITEELRCSTIQSFSLLDDSNSVDLISIYGTAGPPTSNRIAPRMLYHGNPVTGRATTRHRSTQHDNITETIRRHHDGRPSRDRGRSHR